MCPRKSNNVFWWTRSDYTHRWRIKHFGSQQYLFQLKSAQILPLVITDLDLILKGTNKQWISHLKKRSQETMREKVYQMMMISFLYVISGVAISPFFEVPFTATSGKDRSWGIWYNLISVFNRLFRLDGYPGLQGQELSQWCIFFVSKGKLF